MKDNQEYSARAHATNIAKYKGLKGGWNIKQLKKYFTDESVDNLLKNVWSVYPIAGLYQLNKQTSNENN